MQVTRVKFNGVDVKLYEPRERPSSGKRPGLIYYHGGGWTTGSAGRARVNVTKYVMNSLPSLASGSDSCMDVWHNSHYIGLCAHACVCAFLCF